MYPGCYLLELTSHTQLKILLMLKNTFVHLQGIGQKTEQKLWAAGIHTWDDFKSPYPLNTSVANGELICSNLAESKTNLSDNPLYFSKLLPSNQHWRLFPHYLNSTAYLDIESTGLSDYSDHITTIALYNGTEIKYYVHNDNLDDFVDEIYKYSLLVTYNGKTFDVPFIEKQFGITLNTAHIDLRYILNSLGYKGGLKGCEKQLGLDRGELEGVDGYFAVLLWQEYTRTGNQKALETLLAYNIEDVINLEALMFKAYNLNIKQTPFYDDLQLSVPDRPEIPFSGDRELINTILLDLAKY